MQRLDYQYIAQWIEPNSRLLDLGCESGDLLCYLRDHKNTHGIGVDLNNDQLVRCLERGIQVVHTDLREDLSLFSDRAFDYVILSQTLQNINKPPQKLLSEMLRVGHTAIVSFPNFAYYPLRLQLLGGAMPSGMKLPYSWHDTPNVRYCTISDFEHWCQEQGFVVDGRIFLDPRGEVNTLVNLRAETAIYRLTAKSK